MKNETDTLIGDAARFEVFCTTACRIAHEFNNFLTPLTAYPQLIKESLPEVSRHRELLDVIEATAKDMTLMTHQLTALSARTPLGKKRFTCLDINSIIAAFVAGIKESAQSAGIVVKLDVASNLGRVEGSDEDVREALENLYWNAVEAMEKGGQLSIKVANFSLEARVSASGLPIADGQYVGICVTDTGAGIPEQLKSKIFEPFVTTKTGASRRRAGLGLTVVFRIMRDHGGAVDFRCIAGKETTFCLYFPASVTGVGGSDGSASLPEVARKETTLTPRNKRRVLVVDDERTIIHLFEMILSSAFPDVKIDLANNGAEAVKEFGADHHGVILMDLHMPIMDGQEAFSRIEELCRERNWEMPSVVFCTGFDPSETARSIVADNSAHCLLSKPVSLQILVEAVKSRLA